MVAPGGTSPALSTTLYSSVALKGIHWHPVALLRAGSAGFAKKRELQQLDKRTEVNTESRGGVPGRQPLGSPLGRCLRGALLSSAHGRPALCLPPSVRGRDRSRFRAPHHLVSRRDRRSTLHVRARARAGVRTLGPTRPHRPWETQPQAGCAGLHPPGEQRVKGEHPRGSLAASLDAELHHPLSRAELPRGFLLCPTVMRSCPVMPPQADKPPTCTGPGPVA